MSSGGATSTQNSGLDPSFAPYLQQYGNFAQGVANLPYQQYNGPRVADLSGLQNQALQGYGQLANSPALYGAQQQLAETMSGTASNQFTPQVADRVTRGVTDAYNRAGAGIRTNFNSAGGIGSARSNLAQDRNDTNLATGLGDSLGSLYSTGYENERNRQLQASGQVPGLLGAATSSLNSALTAGDIPRQQQQQVMNTLYGDWQGANQYPNQQLNTLISALGPLFGAAPRTTTTTGPGSDPVAQGIGIMGLGNYLGSGKNSGGTGVNPNRGM